MESHVAQPHSPWMEKGGAEPDVVVSSRVRLARNTRSHPFPGRMSDAAGDQVLDLFQGVFAGMGSPWEFYRLREVPPVDLQVLVEKHLISSQLAQEPRFRGLSLTGEEDQSVMINEEDHIRIQAFAPGLALEEAWKKAAATDDAVEATVEWAFDATHGYLTACPTNLGTGLRVSVMVHLPGLTLTQSVGHMLQALSKLGVAVRGLYGEGTQAVGQIFQLSNQITLGQTEAALIDGVRHVVGQVVERERQARERLATDRMPEIQDRVFRARGTLENARLISADEAIDQISTLRLGVELGLLKKPSYTTLNALSVMSLPGYLERSAGQPLSRIERLSLRASLIRERLTKEEA